MSVKFDDALYRCGTIEELIELDKLVDIRLNNPNEFNKKYVNHLYCSYCKVPQLTLVHLGRNYYLRGFPNQQHSLDCSKGFECLDDKAFQDFLDNDEHSFEFVANKLEKLIDKMQCKPFRRQEMLVRTNNKRCTTEDVDNIEQNRRSIYKQIPVKSLTTPFDDDDFDKFKLFYGNVDLKLNRYNANSDNEFYSLQVFLKEHKGLICSISMKSTVGKHLLNKYNLSYNKLNRNQYLAVATSLMAKGDYKNGRLIHSDLCVIRQE
ncbi:MAG: hypothetical protein ILA17_05395 [Ruminococcus sp.]|nr:hypothetical protein [Ruminococcus sp.]